MRKTIGKRIITIVLAVAMVVTMFVSVFTQAFAYTETTGTVSNDNVKVRESASTTASQVASLKKGDTIDIIGEETDSSGYVWYKIRVNKSEQGYVRSEDVEFVVPKTVEGEEIVFYNAKMEAGIPPTGDASGRYVLYGICAFLAAVNTEYLRHRSRRKKS